MGYNYRSHTETECLILRFIELYLDLSMSDDAHTEVRIGYKPQALTFRILLRCEYKGVKVSAVYEALDESADAKDISSVIENLIQILREEYGKAVSKDLLRRRE